MTKKTPQTCEVIVDPKARYAGIADADANLEAVHQLTGAIWVGNSKPEDIDRQTKAAMAQLLAFEPRDAIEGQIALQLIASHNAAVECYRRAMLPGQSFEGRNAALNQANKLSRTYAQLVESLNRHRGKGQQRVTVEHVHVHAGGQAVVGAVTAGGRGSAEIKGQPHEQPAPALAHDARAPLLGDLETLEEAVPSASRSGA